MEYTSISSGKKMEIRKIDYYRVFLISQSIEDELRQSGKPVDPPTYDVEIAGSGEYQTQTHYHEVTTDDEGNEVVNSSLSTPEHHAAWDEYLAARREQSRLYIERLHSYALRNGIVAKMEKGWEEEQEYDGIKIPEHPQDKWLHYISTVLLPDIIERREVANQIVAMSVPSRNLEVEEAVKEFFRSEMETNAG